MTTNVQEPALVASDRCDRCGAQAYLRATLPGGAELLFCAHHVKEHGDALRETPGVVIHDETHRITADAPQDDRR